MNNGDMLSSLLYSKDCPFDYRCLANDCILCAERQGGVHKGQDETCENAEVEHEPEA